MQNIQTITEDLKRLPTEVQQKVGELIKVLGKQSSTRNTSKDSLPFNRLRGCLKPLSSTEEEIKELKQIWEPKL